MLDDGGHRGVGHGLVGGQVVGDVVLVGDAEVGPAGADQRVRAVLGRLDDLNLEALVGEVALVEGHVEAGVVGVGRVVQDEGDLGGLAALGVTRSALLGDGAPARGERGRGSGAAGDGEELAAVEVLIGHGSSLLPSSRACRRAG